jgi:predicted PhzF superfamily epimerase YddE/YHI9
MAEPTRLRIYQVDAFTDRVFSGNPAAVCPLEVWLPDTVLQGIAAENNVPATAFFARDGEQYRLRWFTPTQQINICGHATLASADVLFRVLGHPGESVSFTTRAGTLNVTHERGVYALAFPCTVPVPCAPSPAFLGAFGIAPVETLRALDHIVVFEHEAQVRNLRPNYAALAGLDLRGVCVTAPGLAVDFVSRFFVLRPDSPEDPVTGSAHCELAPYWAQRLGKTSLVAHQVSPRGGEVLCDLHGDRVTLRGRAAHYMTADITLGVAAH